MTSARQRYFMEQWIAFAISLELAVVVSFAIRIGRAEAESTRAIERATDAARVRDEILAVVSHDLRGPLHAISLATEALPTEGSTARA